MKQNVSILTSILCLVFCTCQTYTTDKLPDTQLRFGSGGGFTGMTTEYTLLKNGQLFVRKGRAGSGEWEDLGRVDRSKVKSLYSTWESHDHFKAQIQKPGNIYYFIHMKKDSLEYRQSWGATGYQAPAILQSFYKQAMDLVKAAASTDESP